MARPLRLEYPGALYHITARGNAQAPIFLNDEDREQFIFLLKDEVIQQHWRCYAWCLMDNHYHFLIETPEANLSRGMQRLNGRYTQRFNRAHQRVGHIFQGRYQAILVEKESHLLELCRYIVLNPVRANMVNSAQQWQWSSYHDTLETQPPEWMATEQVLTLFSSKQDQARLHYRQFILDHSKETAPWQQLRGQLYLGSSAFRQQIKKRISARPLDADIPQAQQHPERPTADEVLCKVAQAYHIHPHELFHRKQHREAYDTSVFLLRRVCNMRLSDVATLAGISSGRVSQIQQMMRKRPLLGALKNYKV